MPENKPEEKKMSRAEKRRFDREQRRKYKRENRTPLPFSFELEFPIQHGKETIKVIKIERRPTFDDLAEAMDQDRESEGMKILIENITDIPTRAVSKMDTEDFSDLMEELEDFLPSGDKDGNGKLPSLQGKWVSSPQKSEE